MNKAKNTQIKNPDARIGKGKKKNWEGFESSQDSSEEAEKGSDKLLETVTDITEGERKLSNVPWGEAGDRKKKGDG